MSSRPAPATTPKGSPSPPRILGIRATVFMPVGASLPKVTATRAYGADVILEGHTHRGLPRCGNGFSAETGAVLIHPFDHRDIVAGQGTTGLEILEQCPDVRTIVVCLGGGGLLAGIALGGQGDPAGRPRHRRAGRGCGVLAAVARGRSAAAPRRRCRRWRTGSPSAGPVTSPSRSSATSWTTSAPSPRSRCRGPCCCASSAPSWSSSPPGWPPSPASWTTPRRSSRRWSPSCRAATSTRCCSCG